MAERIALLMRRCGKIKVAKMTLWGKELKGSNSIRPTNVFYVNINL